MSASHGCEHRSAVTRPSAGAVAALLLVTLAACGGRNATPPPDVRTTPDEPVPDATLVASGISFLPPLLTTARQYRPSVVASSGEVFFTDGSDLPLKKASGVGPPTPLAARMGAPGPVAVFGDRLVFAVDDALVDVDLITSVTRKLATGSVAPTPDVLVDGSAAYWVKAVPNDASSVPLRRIERIEDAGTVGLVERGLPITGLAQDDASVYWVEADDGPISAGCACGSAIRKVPKAGGAATLLVDGALNEPIPDLGPGATPASWSPVGGLATDGAHAYFAHGRADAYRVVRVPVGGGAAELIATVPRASSYDASVAPRRLAVDGTRVYWIDATRLAGAPLAGGPVETLASDLVSPVGLVVAGGDAWIVEDGATPDAGTIRRVPLAGGASVVVRSALDLPSAFALDGGRFYWTEAWRVAAAPRAGGDATTLASGIQDPYFRIAGVVGDDLLVLDGPLLKRVPRAGGTVERVLTLRTDTGTIAAFAAEDAATDGQAVYLVDRALGGASSAYRLPLDGGAVTRYSSPQLDGPADCVLRVAVDSAHVYWSSGSTTPLFCRILRAPIAGGGAETLVDAPLLDFAVDGGDVYFSEARVAVVDGTGAHSVGDDAVMKRPAAGGTLVRIAWAHPSLVAVAGTRAFWIDLLGAVGWASKDGTTQGAVGAGPFEENAEFVDALWSDGTSAYWTNTYTGELGALTFP